MSNLEGAVMMLFLIIPFAILYAVIETWREKKEFQKWLKEGRWKFEKFRHGGSKS